MASELDDVTSTLEELQSLRVQAKDYKDKASRHSENLLRANKEIGALRKDLQKIPALQAEIDVLEAKNAELATELKAANRALEQAETENAKLSAKAAGYDKYSELLRASLAPSE